MDFECKIFLLQKYTFFPSSLLSLFLSLSGGLDDVSSNGKKLMIRPFYTKPTITVQFLYEDSHIKVLGPVAKLQAIKFRS